MRQFVFPALLALTLGLAGSADALAKAGSTQSKSKSKTTSTISGARSAPTSLAPMAGMAVGAAGAAGSARAATSSPQQPQSFLTPPSASSQRSALTPPPPPKAAPRPGAVESQPLSPAMPPAQTAGGHAAVAPMAGLAGAGAATSAAAAAHQPGFFQRNPFLAGMTGGLVGAGIGSMLFGHSPALAAATETSPVAGMLGLALQIALIGILAWLAFKLFRGRAPAEGNPYAASRRSSFEFEDRGPGPSPLAGPAPYQAPHVPADPSLTAPPAPQHGDGPVLGKAPLPMAAPFTPTAADQQAFTDILVGVQTAWSTGDRMALQRLTLPEMAARLVDDLETNARDGVHNRVENVVLLEGEVLEAGRQDGHDVVNARLVFQCLDIMVRADTGALVSGDPTRPERHAERWTFVRPSNGGLPWRLATISPL